MGAAATQSGLVKTGGAAPPSRATGRRLLSALVADDDAAEASRVARSLRSRGWSVRQTERGLSTLSLVRAEPPDLLVVEAGLPEISGFELAQRIKQNDRYRRISIIVVSARYRGWRVAEDLREAFQVEGFLEKPFRLSELWHTVEQVLESRSIAHEASVSRPVAGSRRMAGSAYRVYREGVERSKAGDIDGAIACLSEGVRLDPFAARIHLQLGAVYLKRKGLTYRAIQAFEDVLKLEPRCFAALRALGTLYEQKGFRNQALDVWERALRCSPDEDTATRIRQHLVELL